MCSHLREAQRNTFRSNRGFINRLEVFNNFVLSKWHPDLHLTAAQASTVVNSTTSQDTPSEQEVQGKLKA